MGRGRLRVYLGASPGVGKTFAALEEAGRLRRQGVDVVVGLVETHGRSETEALLDGLEIVRRRRVEYRGTALDEMDLDAVLRRRPAVVVVDELAHTNVPGSGNEKRWQDVDKILDAGIDVISTVNIQHFQSLNDVVAEITGVRQAEVIPDEVVRSADEIELVDLTQEGIRHRLAEGKIYPSERVDAALANFFRAGNLAALRELALSWTADRVDEALDRYRRDHGIDDQWETRERVVVGVTGSEGGDVAIRRAARMAMRSRGVLIGVHVRLTEGLSPAATRYLDEQRRLLEELGGEYHEMSGPDVAEAVVEFAASHNATQLVVGASRRNRWDRLLRGSVIEEILRRAGTLDVHVISDPDRPVPERFPRPKIQALPRRRVALGWAVAILGFAATTALMLQERSVLELPNVLLVYLLVAMSAAWVGGIGPGLGSAIGGFLAGNYLFTPPYLTWTIDSGQDVFALVAFAAVAGVTGGLVGATARRANQVEMARAEATTLSQLAIDSASGSSSQLIDRLHSVLGGRSLTLFARDGHGWKPVVTAGAGAPALIDDADRVIEVSDARLGVGGPPLTGAEERLLTAFRAQLEAILRRNRLADEAAETQALARADELRTALLRAVSHDLRSPLSAIKATVSGLLVDDVPWTMAQVRELLASTYTETMRLDHVVADLLDAGRIESGALRPIIRSVGVDEVVASAMMGVDPSDLLRIKVEVPETLPSVATDPALLERVVENLIRNAVGHTSPDTTVTVDAGRVGDNRVDIRVIDHGAGLDPELLERLFLPFQRADDAHNGGVGLGLAVAKGLCDALGHTLTPDETQGGGATMTISLSVPS